MRSPTDQAPTYSSNDVAEEWGGSGMIPGRDPGVPFEIRSMETPFPGMDPYLEHPALWPGVHTRLIVALADQLGPKIRPRYVASVEDRVFIESADHDRIPDVWVQETGTGRPVPAVHSGTAIATPLVVEVQQLEVREHYITILDRYRDLGVVTVIELVSPSNKAAGPGRDSYLAKQRRSGAVNATWSRSISCVAAPT